MKWIWFKTEKKQKKKWYWIAVPLLLLTALLFSVKKNEKLRFVEKMGNGINLGNTLDSTRLKQYKPGAEDLEYETFWGNPKINKQQFAAIRKAGFGTVRIPVTFEEHLDEEFQISKIWLNRVKEVVDMALSEQLYVIVDIHAETYLNLEVSQKPQVKQRLQKVWQQLAEEFKDYDHHLLFEGMNEPRLRDSGYEWTEGTPELRAFVNELNEVFVNTVRDTGGYNKNRYLLICPYCNNPLEDTVGDLEIPTGNIIVAVHMYKPYEFAQNLEGTDKWSRDNSRDTEEITKAFSLLKDIFVKKGVPVIFTEFGCADKGNTKERREWLEFYRQLSKEKKIPLIWWDNGSTYQLLDRETGEWIYPELVSVLTK